MQNETMTSQFVKLNNKQEFPVQWLILSHIHHLQQERCHSDFLTVLASGPKLARKWGNSQSTIRKTEMSAIFSDSLFLCHQNLQHSPFPGKTFTLFLAKLSEKEHLLDH